LNFVTAYAWGAMTRWLTALVHSHSGGSLTLGGVLFLYSVPKGILQFPAGWLSDRKYCCGAGSKEFVVLGLVLMAVGLCSFGALAVSSMSAERVLLLAAPAAILVGGGTALTYSPIVACVVARTDSLWRASAIGTYRAWRDAGYAVGGIVLGHVVDISGGSAVAAPFLASVAVCIVAVIFRMVYKEHDGLLVDTTLSDPHEAPEKFTDHGQTEPESVRFGISYDGDCEKDGSKGGRSCVGKGGA